jgi:alpha-galactosidase
MDVKNAWFKEHLTDGKSSLPFSFTYDGRPSAALLAEWPVKAASERLDANRTRRIFTLTDPKTGLEVRCVAVDYADYPVVEWTVYLKNTGTADTPILENIQGMDARFDAGVKGEFVLHGIKGDFQSAESYEPYRLVLSSGSTTKFGPHGPIWAANGPLYPLGSSLGMPGTGKPCDGPDGWPYFNLQIPGGGTIIAVGWPGQWAASFTRDAATGLTVRAGQELTHLYLKPGEEIRTPLMALLFWQGDDVVASQNLWRRWYCAHNLPRIEGKLQSAVTFFCGCGTEKERPIVQSWLDAGIHLDVFWRDAGGSRDDVWFTLNPDPLPYPWPGMYWMNSGTWEPDPKKFPKGFKPYSDWVRARGMQFMLWFEPERVGDPNSWLGKNHPEWILPNDNMGAILDEGNPAARQWLTDHISGMIDSQGLDWYREDMNGGGPCPAWRKKDTPDRQGMTENLYVQGHLAFWDELRRRHPHLRIDSCASGGRRNDLETMRRAVPLLRSDYTMLDSNMADKLAGVIEGNQCHTYGVSAWLPFHGSCVGTADLYAARSHYVPGFGAGLQLKPENQAAVRRVYDECRQVAPFVLEGDYYPLIPYSRAGSDWLAWQFNRPKSDDGVVQAFRRTDSPFVVAEFRLRGLDPAATYEITNFDVAGTTMIAGKELIEKGLNVEIKDKPGAAVITYRQQKEHGR